MKKQQGFASVDALLGGFGLVALALWAAAIGGWIANIYKLFAHSPALALWGTEQAVRVVGIVLAPFGAILGYL